LGSCVAGLSLFLLGQWRGEASHAGEGAAAEARRWRDEDAAHARRRSLLCASRWCRLPRVLVVSSGLSCPWDHF
ncbi:hypothetical protein B0H13DRAFT_2057465, partial [Mycena leptocephala]